MGRSSAICIAAVLLASLAGGCATTGEPYYGPSPGTGAPGGQPDPAAGAGPAPEAGGDAPASSPGEVSGFEIDAAGSEILRDLGVLFGADRKPAYAMEEIRAVHDLKDWSHRMTVRDAVDRCREAVADLERSDYTEWDETGMVVVVLSTMAIRDSAAISRNDCLRVLAGFYDWVHPLAEGIPAPVASTEESVLVALKAMDSVLGKPEPFTDPADRLVLTDAVAVLGSHPWSDLSTPDARLARNRLAQPRGVVRAIAARTFRGGRSDPVLADTLDRSIIRVTDQVLSLSLLACLADPAAHVRAAAGRALADRKVPGAVAVLAKSLGREAEDSVRIAFIAVLGDLAEGDDAAKRQVIPALAGTLSNPNGSVRAAASRELARLTGDDPGAEATDWQRWWREKAPEYEKP